MLDFIFLKYMWISNHAYRIFFYLLEDTLPYAENGGIGFFDFKNYFLIFSTGRRTWKQNLFYSGLLGVN